MAGNKSPAVQALENEQAMDRGRSNELDERLQGTFPASDPVSATRSGAPDEISRLSRNSALASDAPRVDEALASILEHRNDPYVEPRENIAALRDEAESLSYRVTSDVKSRIRSNPWQAVGVAAALGFVFGLTR
ncbi:hypothetical protein LH464_14870 [Neorhizobium sp. T786]|uniref:glycine zipper domain-containing protein n=1 Tax=Pseudorhizobium xiangyangii TaxID=2883104 RepID=UPI001CFF8939|nr:hypothetical protein [Neorhizobium xiangyangii]MCB5203755.1 hypothetical protein [Neorhizobium xiangyangii]